MFYIYGVECKSFKTNGTPLIKIEQGSMRIGSNFKMNNGLFHNIIGRQQRCLFIINRGGHVEIGSNVGISGTAIHCNNFISIGDNVKIGGNTVIYDTDFHSLKHEQRNATQEDISKVKSARVNIGNNVFIGAHSTILKGVNIGNNSIIGAGSVVTKSIPDNQLWGGNPAKFIREI